MASYVASSSFLLLVVMPGAPSSVLVPSSGALCSYSSFLLNQKRKGLRRVRVRIPLPGA